MDGSTQPSEADLRPEIELEELLGRADFRGVALPSLDHLRSARDWTLAISDPGVPVKPRAPAFTLGLIDDDDQHFFTEIVRGARRAAGEEAELLVRMATAGPGTKAENEAAIVQELISCPRGGLISLLGTLAVRPSCIPRSDRARTSRA